VDEPLLEEIQGYMVSPTYFTAYELEAAEGALFDDRDLASGSNLAVVGSALARDLYADGNALGKRIRLNGSIYTIGAVLKPYAYSSEGLSVSLDDLVYIPTVTSSRGGAGGAMFFGGADELSFAVSPDADVAAAARGLEASLNRVYGDGAVTALTELERIRTEIDKRKRILSLLAVLASAVGLAAAVNIFNLMTGRVSRRARSIAIQRSLGAGALRVFRQTILESLVLGLAGALAGALLSLLLSGILGGLLESGGGQSIALSFRADLVALVALLSVAAAALFAALPAADAAGTVIVDALRDE